MVAGCPAASPPDAGDAAADAGDSDAGREAADAGPAGAAFGEPCTVGSDTDCAEGLFCLQGPSGGSIGFCTKTCPPVSSGACPDAPEGTSAYCLVTNVNPAGDKGCAFLCELAGTTFPCPGELECSPTEEPPGSGQRLCLP